MPGSTGNGAVMRSTLRRQIADALRDEVLAGRLQPGQEFTVKEIAEQYGVSATPVREALVDLSAQGLLDADQHRGFRVHEYSVDDFRGMIEARGLVVEGMFLALTEGRPNAVQPDDPRAAAVVAGIRRRGEEAQRAAAAGDLTVLIGYDLRFWHELGACFGNPYLPAPAARPVLGVRGAAPAPAHRAARRTVGRPHRAGRRPGGPRQRHRPVDHRRLQRPLDRPDRAPRLLMACVASVRMGMGHARQEPLSCRTDTLS
jgi:DNA-binding GntR family transcriptional regulator